MSDAEASAAIAETYLALLAAHTAHPNSRALDVLHAKLARLLEAYIADHPAVVRPFDGTDKPPPP